MTHTVSLPALCLAVVVAACGSDAAQTSAESAALLGSLRGTWEDETATAGREAFMVIRDGGDVALCVADGKSLARFTLHVDCEGKVRMGAYGHGEGDVLELIDGHAKMKRSGWEKGVPYTAFYRRVAVAPPWCGEQLAGSAW
jgi:hypothetical protein